MYDVCMYACILMCVYGVCTCMYVCVLPATAASAAHAQARLTHTVVAIASVDEFGSVCMAAGIAVAIVVVVGVIIVSG